MTGRNDPCPCGSGKKYKKCCLLKDLQEAANRRQETPAAAAPVDVPEPEPDPLIERMNAWWEAFSAAPYDEKWAIAHDALHDEPELMDREMIFEVGNELFDPAIERGDFERFDRLMRSFEEMAPEAYRGELTYMVQWRFTAALARKDWPAVEEAFMEFSQIAGRDLDMYYRLVQALAYHGRLELLLKGMAQALPSIQASEDLVEWAADDFAEDLGKYELLYLLQENPDLTVDDPELQERMAAHGLTIIPEKLAKRLDYRSGRKEPAWEADEFVLSFEDEWDDDEWEDDPARQKLSLLLLAWTRYASLEEGVPLTKAEMVREELYHYLVGRSEGRLTQGPSLPDQGRKRSRKKRVKQRKTPRSGPATLVPDRQTVDRYLADMGSFFSARYYGACAFFELLPVWLHFLRRYELIDAQVESQALGELKGLKGDMVTLAERVLNDRQVIENLSRWPEREDATS